MQRGGVAAAAARLRPRWQPAPQRARVLPLASPYNWPLMHGAGEPWPLGARQGCRTHLRPLPGGANRAGVLRIASCVLSRVSELRSGRRAPHTLALRYRAAGTRGTPSCWTAGPAEQQGYPSQFTGDRHRRQRCAGKARLGAPPAAPAGPLPTGGDSPHSNPHLSPGRPVSMFLKPQAPMKHMWPVLYAP